ncbi:MAG: TIGR02206 family membrane protein [Candidatus Neomarinimicrobiota bacterium]
MHSAFKMFGRSHFLTLMVIIVTMFVALYKLQTCSPGWRKKYFHPFLAIFLFTQIVGWRIIFILQHDFALDFDLPLHLCGLCEILLFYYLLRPNQTVFDILYYWIMSGSTLAVLIPELQWDIPSARYFAMFIPHSLMVFCILYFIIVLKIRPSRNSYWKAFQAINILALIMIPINLVFKANYLYLRDVPPVQFGPIKLLPQWPWYLLVLDLFFIFFYRLLYQPFYQSSHQTACDEKETLTISP